MSKYHLKQSNIYYPDTNIPKNKLEIHSSEEIHEFENELLNEAYEIFISELDENTKFDEDYFISLHKRTFESLYEWAGKYRNEDMIKGDSRFCLAKHLNSSSKKIFGELTKESNEFKNYSKEVFAQRLAYYKCEIIALHPFSELNGRVTRLFFDLISAYNGYELIDYSSISPEEYIEASIECVQFANCEPMEKIILNGLKK